MTDVLLRHTENGGDVQFVAGQAVMDDGLFNAVYLSLFGGNDDDSGLEADDRKQWWGNFDEPELTRRNRSETQFLLNSLPLVPANLRRVEDAAARDLEWMTESIADSVVVTASIPALNTINLNVDIVIDDKEYNFAFTESARRRLAQ